MARLRAVASDEKPVPARPLSVAEAAQTGDRLQLLVSMRDRIAKTVSDSQCPPRDLASLTRRLADVSKEIEALTIEQAREEAAAEVAVDAEFDAAAL